MSTYFKYVFFSLFCFLAVSVNGQKKVKLEQADELRGGRRDGQSFMKYKGNVIFSQENTTIYADSAFYFRSRNLVEAYGRVKILEGDSITVTARKLVYNGDAGKAQLRENVVFSKKAGMTLYTDNLDYDLNEELAEYFDGGRLVDSTNVLVSERGTYNDRNTMATFRENVVATFPDFTLESDALRYNTTSEVVYFIAPTTLTRDDGSIVNYTEGTYDTKGKTSQLRKGNIVTEEYNALGNKIFVDDANETYRFIGEVLLESKENDVIITGEEAFLDQASGISKVYGNPVMKRPFSEGDTLFLTADTLVSIDSKIDTLKRVLAYHNVKIYKNDLQGIADSLSYIPSDSIIKFFQDPVLWTSDNQMTADTITVFISNKTIDRMEMDFNSFVISEDTIKNHNQVKGRKMTSLFNEGKLSQVNVDGNCETIFFALDEVENYVIGMNKIICSNMKISFKDNVAQKVLAVTRPDATFTPPHELTEGQKTLQGFNWQIKNRPTKKQVLHIDTTEVIKENPSKTENSPGLEQVNIESVNKN